MKDVPSRCSDWWIHWTRCVAACVLCAMMLSCGGLEKRDRLDNLQYTTNEYWAALRWGRYNEAAGHLNIRNGERETIDIEYLKNIRVTSYVMTESAVTSDQTESLMTVEFSYYHEDDAIIRKLTDKQVWWYQEERRKWWLDGELPDFK
ncbi:MAG: hypothetical protein V3U60_04920 [Gammaproteobacteria bacterium]